MRFYEIIPGEIVRGKTDEDVSSGEISWQKVGYNVLDRGAACSKSLRVPLSVPSSVTDLRK